MEIEGLFHTIFRVENFYACQNQLTLILSYPHEYL